MPNYYITSRRQIKSADSRLFISKARPRACTTKSEAHAVKRKNRASACGTLSCPSHGKTIFYLVGLRDKV